VRGYADPLKRDGAAYPHDSQVNEEVGPQATVFADVRVDLANLNSRRHSLVPIKGATEVQLGHRTMKASNPRYEGSHSAQAH